MKLKIEETMPSPMPTCGLSESEMHLTLNESILIEKRGDFEVPFVELESQPVISEAELVLAEFEQLVFIDVAIFDDLANFGGLGGGKHGDGSNFGCFESW